MRRLVLAALAVSGCGPATPTPAPGPTGGGTPPARFEPGGGTADPADPDPASPRPATGHAATALPGDAQALLDLHNQARGDHCAPALAWSPELATVAQRWADHLRDAGCVFEHSDTELGENLAMGTSGALDADTIVGMWYREVDGYDFKHPGFAMSTGHFTQLVWLETARVGCGRSVCRGMDIVVCNYDPPGNVETQFRTNVLSRSACKGAR